MGDLDEKNLGESSTKNVEGAVSNETTPVSEPEKTVEDIKPENTSTEDAKKENEIKKENSNPFVQSTAEFRQAEDDYFSQISAFENSQAKTEPQLKIEVKNVDPEKIKFEQELAEREAKLRLQKQETAKREAELQRIEEAKRKAEEEKRLEEKRKIDEENKKKNEQEERIRKLEEEERLQKQKLLELEKAEKEYMQTQAIVNADEERKRIEEAKRKGIDLPKTTVKKEKKKMKKSTKFLIALICVVLVGVIGFCVYWFALKAPPPPSIVAVDLHLSQTTFYEGDELFDLTDIKKNYIVVHYSNERTETKALDFAMISSDFVEQMNSKTYISIFDNLVDSTTATFSVLYEGFTASTPLTIYGIEKLGEDVYFDLYISNSFSEFDYLKYDDIGVLVTLDDETDKRLTPLQYDLYVQQLDEDIILTKEENFFQLPSLIDIGIATHENFTFEMRYAGVGDDFIQPTCTKIARLDETVVSSLSIKADRQNIYSLDFYETPLIYDNTKCSKNVVEQLYNIINDGVFAKMQNNTQSLVKLGYAYFDGTTNHIVYITKTENVYDVTLTPFTTSTDARLYFTFNEFVPDAEANTINYIMDMLGAQSRLDFNLKVKSFADATKEVNASFSTVQDGVVSASIISGGTYTGAVVSGAIIDATQLSNIQIKYVFSSGVVIEYNNSNNKITKINNTVSDVSLGENLSFVLKVAVYSGMDSERAFRFDSENFVFGYQSNGIGEKIKIYLKCDAYVGATVMAYMETEQALQEL